MTGSIWGKPTWGTWWEWDGRMTSVLILFFLYIGVIILRRTRPDLPRGYKVPFYPVLPIASTLFCAYLIFGPPADTYALFAVWVGAAALLYFGYSMRRSALAQR
jgi:APA family basic amino acid/polyamine antiporter